MSLFLMRPATENHEIVHQRKFWTHEKKLRTHKIPTRKNVTYKIPTRKNLGPTKYLRENILNSQNTHEKKFWTHEI